MRPILCGHCGAAGLAPENSLIAIDMAVRHGMDAVELDIRCSSDGVPLLMHDPSCARTATAAHVVDQTEWRILKQLRLRDGSGGEPTEQTIPSLTDALDHARGRLITVIEIKSPTPVPPVLEAIRYAGVEKEVIVMSFDRAIMAEVHERAPTLKTGLIWQDGDVGATVAEFRNLPIVSSNHKTLSPKMLHDARRRGLHVWAWTVNEVNRMRELAEWGVSGIISDYPDRLQGAFSDD